MLTIRTDSIRPSYQVLIVAAALLGSAFTSASAADVSNLRGKYRITYPDSWSVIHDGGSTGPTVVVASSPSAILPGSAGIAFGEGVVEVMPLEAHQNEDSERQRFIDDGAPSVVVTPGGISQPGRIQAEVDDLVHIASYPRVEGRVFRVMLRYNPNDPNGVVFAETVNAIAGSIVSTP